MAHRPMAKVLAAKCALLPDTDDALCEKPLQFAIMTSNCCLSEYVKVNPHHHSTYAAPACTNVLHS